MLFQEVLQEIFSKTWCLETQNVEDLMDVF